MLTELNYQFNSGVPAISPAYINFSKSCTNIYECTDMRQEWPFTFGQEKAPVNLFDPE